MNPDALLQQLADIHEPASISWWPLAIGWWLLIFTILMGGLIVTRLLLKKRRNNAYRRTALMHYRAMVQNTTLGDHAKFLACVELLRRASQARPSVSSGAGLCADHWLCDLQQSCNKPVFTDITHFESMLYGREGNWPYQQFIDDGLIWLKHHRNTQTSERSL